MPISPNQGSTSGNTSVTITGVNLSSAVAVNFGTKSGTIVANTPTSITVTSPAGTGVVPVEVVTGAGTSNPLQFFYIQPPIVTSLSSYNGAVAGGNTINIYGYNLTTSSSVTFGTESGTPTIINDGQISVVVPAGTATGTVNVNITSIGGASASLQYEYIDVPTITSLSPTTGPTTGATFVTIIGTNLTSTTSITFGGIAAAFGVINATTISAITPAGSAGAVDVVLTTNAGSATAVGGFTYVSDPGI